jgi:pimeloyl-ACP methyl ester carboxylesterase
MAGAGVRDVLIGGPWQHVDLAANAARFHVARGTGFPDSRRLVLLLHGFAEFWWAWRHQIPALDRAGYAVAAMDLRGYGASDKTPRGYDPRTSAADIAGVVRSLGHRQAVLVGHDWGGMAAWATAAYAPEQVRALAMIAAPHPLAYPWWRNLGELAFHQLPMLPERRMMAADGAYVERLLRARAAPGRDWLSGADARHYRDALMLWPSPHCALEYQRMYGAQVGTPVVRSAAGCASPCCRCTANSTRCFRSTRCGPPRAGSTDRTSWSACPASATCPTRKTRQPVRQRSYAGWTPSTEPATYNTSGQ